LSRAAPYEADLADSLFSNTNLENTNLCGANLFGAEFVHNVTLSKAFQKYTNVSRINASPEVQASLPSEPAVIHLTDEDWRKWKSYHFMVDQEELPVVSDKQASAAKMLTSPCDSK